MKSLDELNACLSAFPCPFASQGDADGNLSSGFDSSPTRSQTNRFGEIASCELFFRRCGGIRTFDGNAAGGYPMGVVLNYDDGVSVIGAESLVPENKDDFRSASEVRIDDYACRVAGGSDGPMCTKLGSKMWKSAEGVAAVSDDHLHFGIDYSRWQVGTKNGNLTECELSQDSYVVIGGGMWGRDSYTRYYGDSFMVSSCVGTYAAIIEVSSSDSPDYSYRLDLSNKGVHGTQDSFYNASPLSLSGVWHVWPSPVCGCANYAAAFFARKGAVVKAYSVQNGVALPYDTPPLAGSGSSRPLPAATQSPLSIFAFPLEVSAQ